MYQARWGEANTELHGEWSCGRSQTSLYNEERPHGAIGNKPPTVLTKSGDAASPSP